MSDVIHVWQSQRALLMSASELVYFHNAPLAHVVAYEDKLRQKRLDAQLRAHRRTRR